MAMIDYGAIVFKNGKCVTTQMFTPMIEAVGWEDTPDMVTCWDWEKNPIHLKGMYFTYIGDEEHTIAFYKEQLTQITHIENNLYVKITQFFNETGFKWSKWTDIIGTEYCTVKHRNGYYVCKWKYKGDRYKVYFGHGVDIDYYKKRHIVNYYRSPEYRFIKLKRSIKDFYKDFKINMENYCEDFMNWLEEYKK